MSPYEYKLISEKILVYVNSGKATSKNLPYHTTLQKRGGLDSAYEVFGGIMCHSTKHAMNVSC